MTEKRGKLIVLEGTDGSGKKTQSKLLVERLQKEGHQTATISFPQYGKKSAGLVEEYLNGKYGKPDEVNPYAASLFYALDRFGAAKEIREALNKGFIVALDRYVDSNAGHQGGKIKNPEERIQFLLWLYHLEYEILNLPKPDLILILHVPADTGQTLVKGKQQRFYIEDGKTYDGHEADLAHLRNAEQSYLWLAEQNPESHKVIECVHENQLLKPQAIHERVWETVKTVLP